MKQNIPGLNEFLNFILRVFTVLAIIVLLTAATVTAQETYGPNDPGWDARLDQLARFEGWIVDSIVIINQNIYDTTKSNRNSFIFRTANKIHTISRSIVVQREILLHVGEPFNLELARETARNLRTSFELYNAQISIKELPNNHLILYLKTIDQWSTFIRPRFTKDSDKSGFRLSLEERNLAGNNQFLGLEYVNPGDESAFVAARFFDQRFTSLSFSLGLEYDDNPENIIRQLTMIRPYYDLNQDWSFGASLGEINGRRDVYSDSLLVVQSQRQGDKLAGFVERRWGSYRDKIGLNIGYTYFSEKSFKVDTIIDQLFEKEMIAEDTTYHYVQLRATFQSINYLSLNRINGMGYLEDFVWGRNYSVSFGRAFSPEPEDYLYDQIAFSGTEIHNIGANLAFASFSRKHWIKQGNDIQALTDASLQWYNYNLNFMTTAFRLRYLKLTRHDQLNLLSLGGLSGLRGYREFFKTGYKRITFNTEGRLFTGVDIFTALFGGVIFWDAGRVWSYGTETGSAWFHSYGVGLRVSLEKSSRSQIMRIDFARTLNNQWALLIGTGQYF